jgi:phospholipase C
MDRFVETVGNGKGTDATGKPCQARQVMDYYDGNTVTALWNYAQRFSMSDNSYGTTFGPSTPGALNLVSGQTHGVGATATPGTSNLDGELAGGSVIGDPQPLGDSCSTRDQVQMTGRNIGDLLNDKGVSWGFFEGGFRSCSDKHPIGAALGGNGQWGYKKDYIPHHQPFQYYASTANPQHLPPASVDEVGHAGPANHQYDLPDFWAAAANGSMPAVSFLKAPGYQDGHAYYSDPVDEQVFLVDTLNRLQQLPEWKDTAVVIAYDDSDGWYDHQMSPIGNQSQTPADQLTGPGQCGNGAKAAGGYQGRCGYGPRMPLLVVSPFAKQNFVDHNVTDQSSILRFIEDNWGTGRIGDFSFDARAGSLANLFDFAAAGGDGGNARTRPYLLDPATGQPRRD